MYSFVVSYHSRTWYVERLQKAYHEQRFQAAFTLSAIYESSMTNKEEDRADAPLGFRTHEDSTMADRLAATQRTAVIGDTNALSHEDLLEAKEEPALKTEGEREEVDESTMKAVKQEKEEEEEMKEVVREDEVEEERGHGLVDDILSQARILVENAANMALTLLTTEKDSFENDTGSDEDKETRVKEAGIDDNQPG